MGFWNALYQAGYCYTLNELGEDPESVDINDLVSLLENLSLKHKVPLFGSGYKVISDYKKLVQKPDKNLLCDICGKAGTIPVKFIWGNKGLIGKESVYNLCPRHWLLVHIGAYQMLRKELMVPIAGFFKWFALPEIEKQPGEDLCGRLFEATEVMFEGRSEEENETIDISDILAEIADMNVPIEYWNIGVVRTDKNDRTIIATIPGISSHYIRKLVDIGGGKRLEVFDYLKDILKSYQKETIGSGDSEWWIRRFISAYVSVLARFPVDLATLAHVFHDIAWDRLIKTIGFRNEGGYKHDNLENMLSFLRFIFRYYLHIIKVPVDSVYLWNAFYLGISLRRYDNLEKDNRLGRLLVSYKAIDVSAFVKKPLLKEITKISLGGRDVSEIAIRAVYLLNVQDHIDDVVRKMALAMLWAGYSVNSFGRDTDVPTMEVPFNTYRGYLLGRLLKVVPSGSAIREFLSDVAYNRKKIGEKQLLEWIIKLSAFTQDEEIQQTFATIGRINRDILFSPEFVYGVLLGAGEMNIDSPSSYVPYNVEENMYGGSLAYRLGYIWGRAFVEGLINLGSFRYVIQILRDKREVFNDIEKKNTTIRYYFDWYNLSPYGYIPDDDTKLYSHVFAGFLKAVMENV